MKALFSNPASIVLVGSAMAVLGSLIAAFGVYLGALQDVKNSQHLLSSLTGGDSHPLIIACPSDGSFSISVKGDYPLHEVQGDMLDVVALREAQAKGAYTTVPVPGTQFFNIGTLSSAYGTSLSNGINARPLNISEFTPRKSYRFIVHLLTRHHTFNYFLALEPHEKYKGAWHQAWQVFRDREQTPMDQSIPVDFPRNKEGEVDFLLLPKSK